MYIITFFIILAVLVFVHEFGHFYAAKKSGVRVDEFGLGFPPRVWSKQVGETLYSINAIPFGGFVRIFGENYEEEGEEKEGKEKAPAAAAGASSLDQSRSFVAQPKYIQITILIAGIVMNIVFAWLLFSISYMAGMTTSASQENNSYITDSHVVVLDTLPNSAAAKAGLLQGDEIFSYNFANATTTVTDATSIQAVTKNSLGKPIRFEVLRVANKKLITITPVMSALTGTYTIGVSMDVVGKVHLPFYLAFWEGAKLTENLFVNIFSGLYKLIHDAVLGHADVSQLSGPVGIARLVGDASKLGLAYLISFTAFISLNLAALNLLPFPALDGGRILFVIIEAIIRKPISPKIANTINAVGFGILILFMLFVTYHDIAKLLG